jgi:hypothetical protein
MTARHPVTLTRAQEKLLYARLEDPSSCAPRAPSPLWLTFILLAAGLLLAVWLGP